MTLVTASCPDFGLTGTEDFLIKQNSEQLQLRCRGTPRRAVIVFVMDQSMTDCIWAGNKTSGRGWPPWKLKHISSVICWQAATQKVEIGINLIFTALVLMLLKKSKPFDCLLLERWLRHTPLMEVTQIIHQEAEKYKAWGACCSGTRCLDWWETRERRFSSQAKSTQEMCL